MTRTRYRIFEDGHPYFITCTIVGWLPVFTRPEAVQIIFDSWNFLMKEKGFRLYGYVVLENHLHLIASAPELSSAIKGFKMFTARQIVDLLEARGAKVLLKQLRALSFVTRQRASIRCGRKEASPSRLTARK